MNQVIFLILRKMRSPLIVLIVAYAISILGFVLIPGMNDQGEPERMSFFHAFYFVSYMATTIGFGEIPYPFTDAQRMWAIISIYTTVVAWLYGIGKILTLIQDPKFKQVVTENNFTKTVSQIGEPFYIICGYGDTGTQLVRALIQRNIRSVVIDIDRNRINELEVEPKEMDIPSICADAQSTIILKEAGLLNRNCKGVVAITDDDDVNLKVAITSKLLNPGAKVVCRAESHETEANMASFGTDHILNPYDIFANHFALALHSPGNYLLTEWLNAVPNEPLPEPVYPPHGLWILCGYGRFGKAVYKNLLDEGISTNLIEAKPEQTGCKGFCIEGRGTEASTLLKANIKEAVGIVAGTDNDANNLSIVMTAAQLSPDLFMVARQNHHNNQEIYNAALLDMVMHRSDIVANDIFTYLTNPLTGIFFEKSRAMGNDWSNQLISRLAAFIGEVVPELWSIKIDTESTPAITDKLELGQRVKLKHLLTDNLDHQQQIAAIALLWKSRDGEVILEPEDDLELNHGDELLFCGLAGLANKMEWVLKNHNVLSYVQTGVVTPAGYLWEKLSRKKSTRILNE